MSKVQVYGAISKVTEHDDGTLTVTGVASSESRDAQREIVKGDAMRAAIPDYMRFPALREMHETWAAGRTLAAEVAADNVTTISAKVVDAEACKKVRERVYNGFSIGGRATKRNAEDPTIIEAIELTEISLVDRPANPDCVLQLCKLDGEAMTEKTIAETAAHAADAVNKSTQAVQSDETLVPATDAVEKAGVSTAELWDARQALEAALSIACLLSMELGEEEQEPEQVKLLTDALEGLKQFIASEVLEGLPDVDGGAIEAAAQVGDVEKGDFPGHPFRGNQHAGGSAEGAHHKASRAAHEATKAAVGAKNKEAHAKAAEAHSKAADKQRKAGNEKAADHHEKMAQYHKEASKSRSVPSAAKQERMAAKKAAESGDLEKVGAKFSAATKKALADHADELKKCHDAIGKCHKAFGAAFADKDDAGGDDDAKKVAAADDMQKALAERGEVLKQATDALSKVVTERDDLAKKLAEFEAASKRKGALRVVEKADEAAGPVKQGPTKEEVAAMSDEDRARLEMKKVVSGGPKPLFTKQFRPMA